MKTEDFYSDFLKIKSMHSSDKIKHRMITELLSQYSDFWRVIGITRKALSVFRDHNFKKAPRMGINRAHKKDRYETSKDMLNKEWDNHKDWWNFYIENDTTVLATSSENCSSKMSEEYEIDPQLGLFKKSGYSWTHRSGSNLEQEFLINLYNSKEIL